MKFVTKIFFLIIISLSVKTYSQITCNSGGDVFVFTSYDGGHLTIDADMNIPGIKIGIRSYERSSVTIVGTYSANIDTIIIRGYNSGNNHCPPAIATNTVVQAAPATVKIYQNGSFSPYYNYTCGSMTASSPIISLFTNGSVARLRGYTGWYECWCNPQKLSIAAAYCCKGAYSCFTALPLNLISFESLKSNEKGNDLKWETQNEVNFDYFEIQSSPDAESFIKVGEVKSKTIHQNSGAKYNFTDFSRINKAFYYRLKMFDKDKTFRYSGIIFADAEKSFHTFELKNTLIENELELQNIIEEQTIEILNVNGIKVKEVKISESNNRIPFGDVPAGMYFIRSNSATKILKIIKL
jgi:hypothetical protein